MKANGRIGNSSMNNFIFLVTHLILNGGGVETGK